VICKSCKGSGTIVGLERTYTCLDCDNNKASSSMEIFAVNEGGRLQKRLDEIINAGPTKRCSVLSRPITPWNMTNTVWKLTPEAEVLHAEWGYDMPKELNVRPRDLKRGRSIPVSMPAFAVALFELNVRDVRDDRKWRAWCSLLFLLGYERKPR
jgi:hypothetical protein